MISPPDYVVTVDLEFTGGNIVKNQITQYGASLTSLHERKVIDSFQIGPIHLDDHREWDAECRLFWERQPQMKTLLDAVNTRMGTVDLKTATKQFVGRINEWREMYKYVKTDPIVNGVIDPVGLEDEKKKKTPRANPRTSKWLWMTDTVSTDVSHLNATLCLFGYPAMHHFFGKYLDVYTSKQARERCLAIGFTEDPIKTHPDAPKNAGVHDARHDAIYIAECFLFYLKLIEDHAKHKASSSSSSSALYGGVPVPTSSNECNDKVVAEEEKKNKKKKKKNKKIMIAAASTGLLIGAVATTLLVLRVIRQRETRLTTILKPSTVGSTTV